ncbi:uncharacterized protein LOC127002995 isoform X6 [Eriocheir sinensis]|uniref:uncharacterized protein LOC127002995 isoform X6 n=1 Tax=Eriocheir sinensis TaxID=95602 RepID=UPI0021CA216B|nr:uncharacterized protein LOC127002995 isoform X6 [Eriocheir sinensis]
MADSLPDSRGGGEAGVAGARTNGPPGGEEAQQQQKKEEATLNPGADAAPSSGQQNECGGTNQHPAGAGGVVPAGGEGGDTDGQQNECGGASECPSGAGSVVQTVKERMDMGSLVVVQNNSENTNNSEPSMTQGELSQGSDETRPALTNMAPAGRGTEDTGDPVAEQNNSEGAGSESSKAHGELSQGTDESKLEKVSVSQAKDPPDRNTPATQEAVIAGAGAPPASVAAVTVSTNPPESLPPLPDNTSNLAGPEQLASGPPAPPPSTEGSAMPSFSVDPLSSVSSDGALQAAAKEQASPKASSPLPAPEAAGAEGSSSESSQLSSVPMESDSCSEVAVGVLRSIVPEEAGGTMAAVSVSQHEDGAASGTQLPVNECLSRVSKSQTDATGGSACAVTDAEKNRTQSEAAAMQENMAGQSGEPMEVSENWDDRNFTCEADTETLPLIVATHSLSHKESTEKAPSKAVESTAAAEVNGGAKKAVPLLVTEPLRPVTIGSSLQPLEELQEATAEEEAPSFTADLAIMDSSADEADSIGGLVINNVIGAADGVVDFQPDEVEAEKELMDISSSAPQITDTTEDDGPSAKRRRLENGTSEGEDRTEEPRTVILKLIPVKNGHGVWDSRKLLEVLSAKGTIMLQVHASKENLELCEADKTEAEKTVDFSAIMTAIKDEDHDPVLSCSSGGGEAESDDPLAIGTSSETNTQPSFARSFPPPQGRSTALQPAIPPRPTFKHLQIPQHYYMRNEVLGLPPPLEFEEPQGSADMSGLDTHSVAFPGPQATAPSLLPLTPGVASEMSRRAQVCGECGKEFFNPLSYNMHVRTHQPWIECDKCPFRTKLAQKLKWHELIHRRNPGFKCFTCKKSFTRIEGLLVHQKKLHHIHQCKYCGTVWRENESLRIHLQEVYSKDGSLPSCWVKNHGETIPDVPQTTETDESQPASTLHQTAGRGTREVQMAQHVDVPDFSKVLVKEEKESFENSEPSPAGPALPDALGTGESAQQCVQVANTLSAPLTTLSSSSAFPAGNAFLTYNPVSQSLQLISPHFILQQQQPRHEKGKGNLATPSPLLPQCVPSVQALASSPTIATFKPVVSSAPNLTPAPQDAQVPDVTPSTSIESDSQAGAESVTLIQQRDSERKKTCTLFRCKLCPRAFVTVDDFQEHYQEAHSHEAISNFSTPKIIQKHEVKCKRKSKAIHQQPRVNVTRNHKTLVHMKAYKCSECSSILTLSKLLHHQKTAHYDKLRCQYFCGKLFDTQEELAAHHTDAHQENWAHLSCPHCQEIFPNEVFVSNHLLTCDQCPPDKRPKTCLWNLRSNFP